MFSWGNSFLEVLWLCNTLAILVIFDVMVKQRGFQPKVSTWKLARSHGNRVTRILFCLLEPKQQKIRLKVRQFKTIWTGLDLVGTKWSNRLPAKQAKAALSNYGKDIWTREQHLLKVPQWIKKRSTRAGRRRNDTVIATRVSANGINDRSPLRRRKICACSVHVN